jgi:putative ABC transport system substrate-binding protein
MQPYAPERRLVLLLAVAAAVKATFRSSQASADQAARAQVRIALVRDGTAEGTAAVAATFRDQLSKLGYVEGRNLEIIERLTNGAQSTLPSIMRDVVASEVDLIVTNATPAATAAKSATNRIPIVVLGMADPVRAGLAQSLARPGGNLTGLSMGYDRAFAGKWLELLQETVPHLKTIAVMSNPNNPMHRYLEADVRAVASQRGLKIRIVPIAATGDVESRFKEAHQYTEAGIIFGDAPTLGDKRKVTAAAAKHRLPVVYGVGSFVESGGLMAYAPEVLDMARRTAEISDMILRGARPGEVPIEQPRKFELLVNLSAARAVGIAMPKSVLLRADKVIQ